MKLQETRLHKIWTALHREQQHRKKLTAEVGPLWPVLTTVPTNALTAVLLTFLDAWQRNTLPITRASIWLTDCQSGDLKDSCHSRCTQILFCVVANVFRVDITNSELPTSLQNSIDWSYLAVNYGQHGSVSSRSTVLYERTASVTVLCTVLGGRLKRTIFFPYILRLILPSKFTRNF